MQLTQRLADNFRDVLEAELQKKHNLKNLEALLVDLLEEIKLNYVRKFQSSIAPKDDRNCVHCNPNLDKPLPLLFREPLIQIPIEVKSKKFKLYPNHYPERDREPPRKISSAIGSRKIQRIKG